MRDRFFHYFDLFDLSAFLDRGQHLNESERQNVTPTTANVPSSINVAKCVDFRGDPELELVVDVDRQRLIGRR